MAPVYRATLQMTSRAVYTPSNITAGHKRKLTNENTPLTFIDTYGPPQHKLDVLHGQLIMVCFMIYKTSGRPRRPGRNSSRVKRTAKELKAS